MKLARKVTHPNVTRTFDLGSHDGTRFLTMELIVGDSLAQRVRGGRLGLPEVLRIAHEIARGLAVAHAAMVIHRDLKPENIMRTPDRIVITDFGIARLADSPGGTTRTGSAIGTPTYMAPEQLQGGEIDGRTDIYALGVMLFQLLTAELPFTGDTVYALAAARLTQPPPDPRTRDATIPEAVAKLVLDAGSACCGPSHPICCPAQNYCCQAEFPICGGGAASIVANERESGDDAGLLADLLEGLECLVQVLPLVRRHVAFAQHLLLRRDAARPSALADLRVSEPELASTGRVRLFFNVLKLGRSRFESASSSSER